MTLFQVWFWVTIAAAVIVWILILRAKPDPYDNKLDALSARFDDVKMQIGEELKSAIDRLHEASVRIVDNAALGGRT